MGGVLLLLSTLLFVLVAEDGEDDSDGELESKVEPASVATKVECVVGAELVLLLSTSAVSTSGSGDSE